MYVQGKVSYKSTGQHETDKFLNNMSKRHETEL